MADAGYDDNFNPTIGIWVPNVGWCALQGANISTDGSGKQTAQLSIAPSSPGSPNYQRVQDGVGSNLLSVETITSALNGLPIDIYLAQSGGPPDSTGLPHGPNFQRLRTIQGKALQSGTITATSAGDTNLTFSVAPKTVRPGQPIKLSGATVEYAYVSDSYSPVVTDTVIPLQNALVQAGNTTAAFDVFSPTGPNLNSFLPTGVLPVVLAGENSDGNLYLIKNAGNDGTANVNTLAYSPMLDNGSFADRQKNNSNAITLLTSGTITANGNSTDQTNYNWKGCKVYITGGSQGIGASAITVSIQIKDPVSGKYQTVLTSASIGASSDPSTSNNNVLTLYPGVTAIANIASSDILPRTWRVAYAASAWGTGGSTLGISCSMIV